jgi:hypothetical protein
MAGSFTGPGPSSGKMKVGKVNRPKRTSDAKIDAHAPRTYPLTDSFASKQIPKSRRDASHHRKSFAQR